MAKPKKYLVIVCGPTASGKTGFAVDLAVHYQTEIISTDSRQIYREMTIGTAKPGAAELNRVPHHFIGALSIHDDYSAGQYERDALELLDRLYIDHDIVIAAGGTGLYIRAITEGFDDIPATDPEVRNTIIAEYESQGLEYLQSEAEKADPVSYAEVDRQNPQRLMRLIEIYRSSGRPKSDYTLGKSRQRKFETIRIGLQMDREKLYKRINARVDSMIDNGLLEEARDLLPFKALNALQTVGYSEWFDHLEGRLSLDEAVNLIKRNSRRYAKRQMTWFRKDRTIHWVQPSDVGGAIEYIEQIRKIT